LTSAAASAPVPSARISPTSLWLSAGEIKEAGFSIRHSERNVMTSFAEPALVLNARQKEERHGEIRILRASGAPADLKVRRYVSAAGPAEADPYVSE